MSLIGIFRCYIAAFGSSAVSFAAPEWNFKCLAERFTAALVVCMGVREGMGADLMPFQLLHQAGERTPDTGVNQHIFNDIGVDCRYAASRGGEILPEQYGSYSSMKG